MHCRVLSCNSEYLVRCYFYYFWIACGFYLAASFFCFLILHKDRTLRKSLHYYFYSLSYSHLAESCFSWFTMQLTLFLLFLHCRKLVPRGKYFIAVRILHVAFVLKNSSCAIFFSCYLRYPAFAFFNCILWNLSMLFLHSMQLTECGILFLLSI